MCLTCVYLARDQICYTEVMRAKDEGFASIPLLVFLLLIVGGFVIFAGLALGTPFLADRGIPFPFGSITFEVSAPANTPKEDIIFVKFESWKAFPLKRVSYEEGERQIWRGSIPISTLGYPGGKISYAYVRNNVHSEGTEYFPPERENLEQPRHLPVELRTLEIQPGKTVKDEVLRWRWFPEDGEQPPDVPSTANRVLATPRINNELFQAGVIISDLWAEEFEALIDPTFAHLKKNNVTWIGIKPPWDYTQTDPLPKIENTTKSVPGYPQDKLRLLIRKAKKAGFKVNLEPQICCSDPKMEGRLNKWYEEWARQLERWLEFHIKIANEEGVDLLILGPYWPESSPVEIGPIWENLVRRMRTDYNGKTAISAGVMDIGGEVLPTAGQLAPMLPFIDYIVLSNWSELVRELNPSREEVVRGAKLLFNERIIPFQQKTQKPIIMIAAYPSAEGGAMGTEAPGMEDLELSIVGPEQMSTVKLDLNIQAWIFDALAEEVAKHPFMVGFAPFAYPYMQLPKEPGHTIRGKPAEVILSRWYAVLK